MDVRAIQSRLIRNYDPLLDLISDNNFSLWFTFFDFLKWSGGRNKSWLGGVLLGQDGLGLLPLLSFRV